MALVLFAVARILLGEPIGAASVVPPINPALPKSAVAPVIATATFSIARIASSTSAIARG